MGRNTQKPVATGGPLITQGAERCERLKINRKFSASGKNKRPQCCILAWPEEE